MIEQSTARRAENISAMYILYYHPTKGYMYLHEHAYDND